jgi:putative lipoprotein
MKAINLPKLVLILLCGSFLVFTSCGKSEIENIPSNNKEQQEQQEAQKKKAQEEADKKKKEQEQQEAEKKKQQEEKQKEEQRKKEEAEKKQKEAEEAARKKKEQEEEAKRKKEEEEKKKQQEKQEELKLSVESLTVKIRERKTVKILNGDAPYTVTDNMTPVVSRIYGKDNFFTVEGIFKGSGNIKVEDSKGRQKLLFVTITEENPSPLQVGKNKITVPYKDIVEVRILNGKGPYKHKIIGAQILQVSFSSDSILIAGSTRGSTKVEVTDGEGKVAVIEVTVQ